MPVEILPSLPTFKSDIWSHEDHKVVTDMVAEWQVGDVVDLGLKNYCYPLSGQFKVHTERVTKSTSEVKCLFNSHFPKANGEQLIWLHRGSCLRTVRWGGERDGGWREEWDTKAVWAHYVDFFPLLPNKRHLGTFRHTDGDHSLLPFFPVIQQNFFTGKSNNFLSSAKVSPTFSVSIVFLVKSNCNWLEVLLQL